MMTRVAVAGVLAVQSMMGWHSANADDVDVAVYGGTPAGIAAAIAAGRDGHSVLLIEPYRWIGGLTTNGLSHPDFRTFEGLNGFYLQFTNRVRRHYVEQYGVDSQQVRESLQGTHGEPRVNRSVLEEMLAEHGSIDTRTRLRLVSVETIGTAPSRRIVSITVVDSDGAEQRVAASVFIDATYEGDLMAAAGVEYRVGREARDEYGESLAPETADGQLQGYNFRLVMTRDPDNRVRPEEPDDYNREEFLPLVELLEAGQFESVFCYPERRAVQGPYPGASQWRVRYQRRVPRSGPTVATRHQQRLA